jgi:membrane-bound lytic murein transglycosylase B
VRAEPYSRPSGARRATRRLLSCVAALLVLAAAAPASSNERGWTYLIDKLEADGVSRKRARKVFRDPRVRPFTRLDYGLYPREPARLYRGLRSRSSIAGARRCRARYSRDFETAAKGYRVPASLIAAIFHVETRCGENKGKDVVLYRLARLAMANEPRNVARNIERHKKGERRSEWPKIEARTRERGKYLEDTFYPEVLASFQLGAKLGIDPLGIIGSKAGAFGIPQFLPSSYIRFAVDGNGNGRVSLHEPADAAHSAANYLAGHGWRPGIETAEKRRVIWTYNRSDAYIDTILFLSDQIERSRN